jgi:hypothetical protein
MTQLGKAVPLNGWAWPQPPLGTLFLSQRRGDQASSLVVQQPMAGKGLGLCVGVSQGDAHPDHCLTNLLCARIRQWITLPLTDNVGCCVQEFFLYFLFFGFCFCRSLPTSPVDVSFSFVLFRREGPIMFFFLFFF